MKLNIPLPFGAWKRQRFYRSTLTLVLLLLIISIILPVAHPVAAAPRQAPPHRAPTDFKPCETVDNDIGGFIFLDVNSNGDRDPNESLYSGADVPVTAYDLLGNIIMTTTSNTSGYYSLEGLADGNTYRIEFGALPAHLNYGVVGSDSQTNIRFVSATTCQIYLGVLTLDASCQDDPLLYSSCYMTGNNLTGENSSETVGMATTYFSRGNNPTLEYQTDASEIGSTFGLAWHVPSQQLFTSSYVKKTAGLGPDGSGGTTTGGIYVLNTLADNTANSALFSDLNAEVNTGNDPHPSAAASCGSLLLLENSNRSCWLHDIATPAQVGKIGLGDIDFSPDYQTLFAVNLNNRSLVGIEVGIAATTVLTDVIEYTYPTRYADCNGGDWRPFALGRHNGDMFLGVTCSAETSLANSDLDAIIYKFDPASPATLSRVARIDLDYTRAGQISDCTGADAGFSADCPATWQPWSDSIDINNLATSQIKYITRDSDSAVEIVYPQPMVSDIEFVGNDLLIGIRDRSADQFGYLTGSHLSPLDTRPWSAFSAGETLCTSYNETTGMFQYDHEFNGICGSRVNSFNHTNEGIGGDEFFNDNNINLGSGNYEELNTGGLTTIPGKDQIVTSMLNPTSNIAASGLGFYNMFNGSADGGVQFCAAATSATDYSNAGGSGDVEALCAAAPIEIGNYVWEDTNGNGIQDVDESSISGLIVTLTCGSFTATTVTDAGGLYYFNSNSNATFIQPLQACTLSFPAIYDNGSMTLVPTRTDAGVNDYHDSDATKGGVIELITPGTGAANHNYDVGYSIKYTDWGDLPDTFETLLASNGARHTIDDALYLGSCIDDEGNGTPDPFAGVGLAGGDDYGTGTAYADCLGGDDEDGIELVTPLYPGEEACVRVTAKNTTGNPATLQGWIDFDGDNTFTGDANEALVFTDAAIQNGTTISNYCFDVPPEDEIEGEAFKGGDVHMRFRLSKDGGLSYDGPAPEGEVEDYYTPLACVGSFVWIDWDEDGQQDEGVGASVEGVTISLYWYGQDGVYDVGAGDDRTYDTVTDASGNFSMCGILPNSQDVYELQLRDSPIPIATHHIPAYDDDQDSNAIHAGVSRLIRTTTFNLVDPDYTAANILSLPEDENGVGDGNGAIGTYPDSSVNLSIDIGLDPHDMGDLPDDDTDGLGFATTYFDSGEGPGALHILAEPLYFGSCADSESNGHPNATATGDDTLSGFAYQGNTPCSDDEDGITFITPLIPGQQACIELTASLPAAMATAVVHAWYDFNGDGNFGTPAATDANEQINTGDFAGGSLTLTGNVTDAEYCFNVPANASTLGAKTYARFRLTNDGLDAYDEGSLGFYGPADMGEVEDHLIDSLYCVGNYVWKDTGTGLNIQDVDDEPIVGHTINMIWGGEDNLVSTVADNLIYTAITDADGRYNFCGIRSDANGDTTPDEYQIYIAALPTDTNGIVLPNQGAAVYLDSNGLVDAQFAASSTIFTLPSGNEDLDLAANDPDTVKDVADPLNDLTFDFGFVPDGALYALGNIVFADENGNSILDPAESGIAGVVVELLNSSAAVISTTTTSVDGAYLFDNLIRGSYQVRIPTLNFETGHALYSEPAEQPFAISPQRPITVTDDGMVGVGQTSEGVLSIIVTLGDAAEPGTNTHGITPLVPIENADLTFDFGFIPIPLYAIGNLVWEEETDDSTHDASEAGIPGVVLELLNGSRAVVMTTTTDADGVYLFDNLPAGTYQTRISPNNFLPGNPLYHAPTVTAFQVSPLAGVSVLDDGMVGTGNATNGVVSSLVVLGNGMEPGTNEHGLTPEVPLHRANLTLDFCFFHDPVYAAGNIIWEDLNENGVYDEASEDGISGVTVELLDNSGSALITTTTNINGVYLFDNLLASSYQIRIPASNFAQGNALYDTPNQTTYQPTIQKSGGVIDDGMIGIGNVFDGVLSPIFTLGDSIEPGTNTHGITPEVGLDFADLTLDFGFVPGKLFAIGNLVFLDINSNSIFDVATESGIVGVTVELLDDENVVIDSMLTDANGTYLFDELPASKYQIRIPGANFLTGQALYQSATDSPYQPSPIKNSSVIDDGSVGIGNSTDGVVSLLVVLGNGDEPGTNVHGITPIVPLIQSDLTLDFGFVPGSLFAIGNFVFEEDTDHLNGIFEPSFESAIQGVLLELYDGPTLIMTTTTNVNGAYLFDNLVEGTYTVKIPLANFIPPGALYSDEQSTPMLVSPQKPITVTDDGMVGFGSPFSGIIATVRLGDAASEPGSNTHGLTPDVDLDKADLTVDFGFYAPDATAVGVQQVNVLPNLQRVTVLLTTVGLLLLTTRFVIVQRTNKNGT